MKLNEVCEFIVDCPHTSAKDEGAGIALIRTPNVGKGRLILENVHRVSESVYQERIARAIPSPGDLILAREAPVGNVAIIQEGQKVCLGQRVVLIRANKKAVDPYYLVYYLLSPSVQGRLLNYTNATTVAHLNVADIRNLEISLPSLPVQQRVGTILSSLDDKIAVNRRICENLEAQAQALFKHWFIDFAPFKDGKFVESELGMIPEGWRVGRLSELGEIVGGATPSKSEESYYCNDGIHWLTPKDLSNCCLKFTSRGEIDITQEGYKSCSAKIMPRGSVLFSSRAPIGYLTIAKNDICTNQGFKSVVPKYAGTAYLYYLLKANTKRIESMATGTTFKEASGSLMKSLSVIVPPKALLDKFENSVKEIFEEQEIIEQESLRLSTLRDTLLPKLMSGEIKV